MNNKLDMFEMAHPWQPEWVVTSEEVDKYIEYLDTERPDDVQARDWFPPYFVYETIKKNGKKGVFFLPSKWYDEYDPMWSEQMEEKTITDSEIQEEEIVRECDKEDCPMFILTKDCLKSGTWKQFFVDGRDEGKSLTSDGINNWDEVVDNIKDPKLKQRAIDTNTLYGDEYPDETHIVYGVLKITGEEMEELCYSLWSDSQEKGEKR